MKKMIMMLLGMVLALSVAGLGLAAGSSQAQAVCPVLGGKVNKTVCTDYQGKRIYFCCSGCVHTFNKSPEKYLKKLEDQGVTPATSPGVK